MAKRKTRTPDVILERLGKEAALLEPPTQQPSSQPSAVLTPEEVRNERYGRRAPFRIQDELLERLRARAQKEEVPLVGLAQWALRFGLDALETGRARLLKTPRGYRIQRQEKAIAPGAGHENTR